MEIKYLYPEIESYCFSKRFGQSTRTIYTDTYTNIGIGIGIGNGIVFGIGTIREMRLAVV